MPLELSLLLRFVILIFAQIFVLDNIQFMGYINPMIYVLFILSLPVKFPKWLSLILAFVLGLIIDIFSNTLGLHTFATVFLAFVRIPIINLMTTFDENVNPSPNFGTFGVNNYVKYVAVCVLLHHLALFLMESFSFASFGYIFIKVLLSSATTIALIFIVQSFKKK